MFKQSKSLMMAALLLLTTGSLMAKERKDVHLGVVNFTQCVLESEFGKEEREAFENLKKQMTTRIEDCEKQLQEIATKFNDSDYFDGLSPEAEAELKARYQTLSEEYSRYQNQFMQVMNQANMNMIGKLHQHVNEASTKIARNENLVTILNKEAAFFSDETLDVTDLVIKEMNREYEKNKKSSAYISKAGSETK